MSKLDKLWEDFDTGEDEQVYIDMERADPVRVQRIERLVKAGISPAVISLRYFRRHPNRWPESKDIFAAARYLKSQID
jgi:hypothetical protein